ncbi:hypothetical protein ACFWG0_36330 [Streptomyces yangpuensis]|uniref:hypothetical protein n=1 Tax=Streptomyces yangpuensis TaxID=1648182 RepID=UPI00365FA31C
MGEPASDRRLYRSNPRYVLRGLDDLNPSQRQAVAGTSSSPIVGGLLVPAASEDGTIKVVSRSLGSLFEQLAVPCWLPSPAWPALDGEELGDLVGAEVLEVQIADRFVTGVEAIAELATGRPVPPAGRLATLSCDAIAYAESLQLDAQADIAARLYTFHRVAIRPAWRTTEYGYAFRARMRRAMPHRPGSGPRWIEGPNHPWRTCRRRDLPARAERSTPKLYVSPTPEHLADTVAASVPLIAEAPGVIGWKVADTIGAMVRPDKFMVYLESERALQDLAAALAPVLAGTDVHGVPFTCDTGLDGLLSWGLDPAASPDRHHALVDSWRTWVTARLAGGLAQARRAGLTGRQAHFAALQRIQAAGVDPSTWQPTAEPVRAGERSAL